MACQEKSNAESIALAASGGEGTGIDVRQLDLGSVFTVLLGAAPVLEKVSKQMKPSSLVSDMMVVTRCPAKNQCMLFMWCNQVMLHALDMCKADGQAQH